MLDHDESGTLERSTGAHRLSSHVAVAVLRASLENVFTATIFLPIALID